MAVIVRDEDGFGRWVNNRLEQQFKLFQPAVWQLLAALRLGGQGVSA